MFRVERMSRGIRVQVATTGMNRLRSVSIRCTVDATRLQCVGLNTLCTDTQEYYQVNIRVLSRSSKITSELSHWRHWGIDIFGVHSGVVLIPHHYQWARTNDALHAAGCFFASKDHHFEGDDIRRFNNLIAAV